MNKYWKWIFAVAAVLLVGLVIWFIFFYNYVPRLSEEEKEKVEQAYADNHGIRPIVWYDENGYVEEFGVWRYIGTYGDCYAFLIIDTGRGATFELLEGPFELYGLSRSVYYPVDAHVVLYNTKQTITYGIDTPYETTTQLWRLEAMSDRLRWLTDKQLEQLTKDIEKLAKAHK